MAGGLCWGNTDRVGDALVVAWAVIAATATIAIARVKNNVRWMYSIWRGDGGSWRWGIDGMW